MVGGGPLGPHHHLHTSDTVDVNPNKNPGAFLTLLRDILIPTISYAKFMSVALRVALASQTSQQIHNSTIRA